LFPEKVENVTIKIGQNAELRCKVENLNNYKVSYKAKNDSNFHLKISISGCLGEGGYPDHFVNTQQCHHTKPSHLFIHTINQPMVFTHSTCPAIRSGLLHVPNQHRSHDLQIWILGNCW